MKPPILEIIRKEEVPEAPDWAERLFDVLNRFIETVVTIFSNNISYADNVNAQIYTDTINQNTLDQEYKIKLTLKTKVQGVQLLSFVKDGGSFVSLTEAPFVNWEIENDLLRIHSITGMDSSSDYRMTLLITGV